MKSDDRALLLCVCAGFLCAALAYVVLDYSRDHAGQDECSSTSQPFSRANLSTTSRMSPAIRCPS